MTISVLTPPQMPVDVRDGDQWRHAHGSADHLSLSYLRSDRYALDLNLPNDSDAGRNVYAIENGVIDKISSADGFVAIRHTLPSITNVPGIDAYLYQFDGRPLWYSGYMHMEIASTLAERQTVARGTLLGTISNVNAKKDPTMPNHLHFAVYDKDGYSFSPYFLSNEYKDITYSGDSLKIFADAEGHYR